MIIDDSLLASADPDLPQELRDYLPESGVHARVNMERVSTNFSKPIKALQLELNAMQKKTAPAQRLTRLRFLAGEFTAIFAKESACNSGCSHCCHIDAMVPRSEAVLIAKATGKTLCEPVVKMNIADLNRRKDFTGVPCTLLVNGRCSIYKDRPLVCRTLVNMDSEDTLCRLLPGMQVPVPYLNTTNLQAYFAYLTLKDQFADIREWFPR